MSNQGKMTGGVSAAHAIKRAPKSNKRVSAHQAKLKLLSTCSGLLFGLGTYWMIDPQSIAHWVEVVTIGVAGGVANYAINTAAISRGAYQAASGVTGAAAASVGAILVTGLTISVVSFTGLTVNSIDQMRVKDFGQAHSLYMDAQISAARQADEVVVAVETAQAQVSGAAQCERVNSCVSRIGSGGEGLTYHTLNGVAQQIGAVHKTLIEGTELREEALKALEEAEAEKQAALDARLSSRKARRAQVQEAMSRQDKALADLDRALPLAVVGGLAESLEAGVELPGDRVLTQRVNSRLAPAGQGITKALEGIEASNTERPVLPPETGVMETLSWVGFFLPLFAMLILIDTLLPSLLWFYTYSALRSRVEPEEDDGDDDDPFAPATVLDTPPVLIGPVAGGKARSTRRAGKSST